MTDWAELTFLLEALVFASSVPFFFLAFASGYLGYMWRAAKANGWGLKLLRSGESGADEWERTIGK